MNLDEFIDKVKTRPRKIEFAETMEIIEANYEFTETAFTNGEVSNSAGVNSGSCKVFSFAKINDLNKEETLALFGIYYRADVLAYPEGDDHQNIRQFIKTGWDGISFDGEALKSR